MYVWPLHFFRPGSIEAGLTGRVTQGGASISGQTQAVRTDFGGLWRVSYSGILIRTPDQVRAWRAWEAHLDGGAQLVVVPIADWPQAPRPMIGGKLAREPLPVAQAASYFEDEDRYGSDLIVASAENGAAINTAAVDIRLSKGSEIRGGERFTIDHPTRGPRAYTVVRVTGVAGEVYSVTIRPPLREHLSEDEAIDFNKPRCVMRGMPDSLALTGGRYGLVGATFTEAF